MENKVTIYPQLQQPGFQGNQGQGWRNPPPPYETFPDNPQQVPSQQVPVSVVQLPAQQVVHVVHSVTLGPDPVEMTCPSCRSFIVTRTESETSVVGWLVAGGLCMVGCWAGCCLIPFCVDSLQDVKHSCPNCNAYLGKYKRH